MAYQNVGTPRFYIDIPTYLNSVGADYGEGFDKSLFTLNPITPVKFFDSNQAGNISFSIPLSTLTNNLINPNKFYFSLLNHNYGLEDYLGQGEFGISGFSLGDLNNTQNVLNTQASDNFIQIHKTGSTIFISEIDDSINSLSFSNANSDYDIYVGSISFGSYYDMPHSADLDLTMEVEFDGYSSFQTAGGSTLTNVNYNGSPYWNDKDGNKSEPFSVGESTGVSKRNGRRNWSLKFSYVTDSNLFASNYMSNTHLETSTDYNAGDLSTDTNEFEYTLSNDDSFIAQVLNKVGNGQRFIFQPDNTNKNPDQFAICVLDQSSLSIKQVAYKVYDISLKIREVW